MEREVDEQRHPDELIAALASRQHGIVARYQLLELGIPVGAVEARLRRGALSRLHRGVYALGHVDGRGRLIGGVLAFGALAALGLRSAGGAWELRPDRRATMDVIVPPGPGRSPRRGFAIHRMALEPFETTEVDGLRLTTVSRTLLDLAEVLSSHELERAVTAAEGMRLFDLAAVRRVLEAHPARVGASRLRKVLALGDVATGFTRSELEEQVLALCARFGVPEPIVNARVAGLEVDFLWPEAGLVVEADSRRHHLTRAAFERDRERDATLLLHGLRVLRLTHARITRSPAEVARTLLALTARRVAVR